MTTEQWNEFKDNLLLEAYQRDLEYWQEQERLAAERIQGLIMKIVAIQKSRVSGEPDNKEE